MVDVVIVVVVAVVVVVDVDVVEDVAVVVDGMCNVVVVVKFLSTRTETSAMLPSVTFSAAQEGLVSVKD